ncbi:NACHT, LRR and PYD domains-containing protein 3-like [Rhinoraja longicauda]
MGTRNSKKDSVDERPSENDQLFKHTSGILAKTTDTQLVGVTEHNRKELETLIKDVVKKFYEFLFNSKEITELDHKIKTLAKTNRITEALQRLLRAVLNGNTSGCRVIWNALLQTRNNHQCLISMLENARVEGAGPNEMGCPNSKKDSVDERPSENDQLFKHTSGIYAKTTDTQLVGVTEHHRKELETLIKDVVKEINESLFNSKEITELDHKEIKTLAKTNRKTEASQRLLGAVLNGNTSGCRVIWNALLQTRNNHQCLISMLENARVEGTQEAENLHRHFLRNWSKNLKVVYTGDEQTAGTRLFEIFYTDLRITGAPPEGLSLGNDQGNDEDVEPHQLLKRNNAEIEETSTTLVYGTAGIGKSTLIQKIINDWATKNIYQEFKYIFYFKFQILNAIKYVTNLNTLVLEAYPYLDHCLECLWKDPKTILFIIDDLDRYDQGNIFSADGPPGQCIHPHSCGLVRDILNSLIHGRLVKGCSLLVTTRPWRLEALQGIPVTSTFHLKGFTPEKVKEYFHRHLGDEVKAKQLVQLLESSDTLGRLSTNPLFCSIITSLPEWSQVGESPMLTIAHTQVLSVYLTTIMGICGYDGQRSRQSLLNLGEEAYKKITNKTFSFKAQSFSEVNQHLPNFTSAFMMEIPIKDERAVVYKFTYTVLQNFVAALVKSQNTPGISLKMLLNEAYTATDERFNLFSRFLVGLSSRRSSNWLERELGSIPASATCSISEWLKESVKRVSNLAGKITQGKFLNILHCLFEFGDPQLTSEALEPMRTIQFNQCSLNMFDCLVLSRTLICCGPIEELDLNSCGIKLEGIRYLEPVLCMCKVLRLKSNHLTDDCSESLLSVIQTNRSLTVLDVSNCDQDKQNRNEFTAEKLQALVQNCRLQKEIRWAHHEYTEQKDSMLDKASNILTIITE